MSNLIKQIDSLIIRAVRACNPECTTDLEAIEKEISFYKYAMNLKEKSNIDNSDDIEMIVTLEEIKNKIIRPERSFING